MTTRLNYLILCLLIIVGIPLYWLFYENSAGDAQPKNISIERLRALSAEIKGERPNAIHYENIASFPRTRNVVVAGQGLLQFEMFILAYKVNFADGKPILIGSGLTQAEAELQGYNDYSFSAQSRVSAALESAAQVIPLDDSQGQIGGLVLLGESGKSNNLRTELESQWQRDAAGQPYPLAPGVVIIPAQGLQDHQRLIYIRLAGGKEYLFAGSISPIRKSWEDVRAPARIMTDKMAPGSREQLFSWLLTVEELKRQAPKMTIVSGYRVPAKSGIIRYFAHD